MADDIVEQTDKKIADAEEKFEHRKDAQHRAAEAQKEADDILMKESPTEDKDNNNDNASIGQAILG